MKDYLQFGHEKLVVYQKALGVLAELHLFLESVPGHHSFVDHLNRAMESVVFNLAEAVRMPSGRKKVLTLEYSIGSVFECAACVDIAMLKALISTTRGRHQKEQLLPICRMLIGLRNSWEADQVRESRADYEAGDSSDAEEEVFFHETLDVYQVSLEFYRWLVAQDPEANMRASFARLLDTLATRIVLNVAEGSGRYSELSRESFLQTANTASVKLGAALDLCAHREQLDPDRVLVGKQLLVRVSQMTAPREYPS